MLNTLKDIDDTGTNLRGYAFHPASCGRVLVLEPPYELPDGMKDLRGVAGVVLKRKPNPDVADYINSLSDEEFSDLHKHEGLIVHGEMKQGPARGPRPPAPFSPPDIIANEIHTLASVFQRLAHTNENRAYFPTTPAPEFHCDGAATNLPNWRMTYALTGPQTLWHSYQRDSETPVVRRGMMGFPMIPKDNIGELNKDYFASEGALMFLTDSANALFHRSPDKEKGRRFVVTFDARSERRVNCGANCLFPCRS